MKSTWFSRWLPVLLVGTFIFLLSSSSDPDGLLPEAVYQWIYRTHVWNIRLTKILGPLAHLSSFGLLAFFLTRALAPRQQNTRNICGLAFLLTCLYALSDEFHQLFVPGRAFELPGSLPRLPWRFYRHLYLASNPSDRERESSTGGEIMRFSLVHAAQDRPYQFPAFFLFRSAAPGSKQSRTTPAFGFGL